MATRKAKRTSVKKPARKVAKRAAQSAKPAAKSRSAAKRPARKAKKKVSAIPKGYHSATPYLVVKGAAQALGFYARAFGAREKVRMNGPDGSVMHAEMQVGDSMIMLGDENLEWGAKSPDTLGGSATHVMLYVRDADAFVARAIAAGASIEQPLSDMFWGDRYGKIRDPFGHVWSVATHVEDVTPKQMEKRMAQFFAQMPQG